MYNLLRWRYSGNEKPYNYLLIIFIFYAVCGCGIILCVYRNTLNICYNEVLVLRYIFLSSNNQYSYEILKMFLLHVSLQNNEAIFLILLQLVEIFVKEE